MKRKMKRVPPGLRARLNARYEVTVDWIHNGEPCQESMATCRREFAWTWLKAQIKKHGRAAEYLLVDHRSREVLFQFPPSP